MTPRVLSSVVIYGWNYDVFLSFRGEDTRTSFTGNLYNSLRQRGIKVFIDDEGLPRGEEIRPALGKAIQQSRIAIIVFSKNYASSTFCLDELVNILECLKGDGRLVWPVFYDVNPSDVRHQRGSYGEALAQYEEKFKDKVQKWRLALSEAANLSGWQLKHGIEYEYEFIGRIVEEVSNKINRTPLHVTNYPVGLESRVQEVNSHLDVWSDKEVKMVGICGTGGIGKTTIARAVHNSIADQFEGLCFLSDVREISNKHGLLHLQEKLLFQIAGEKDIKLGDVHKGISIIRHRFRGKKILLILDDVDRLEQLQALAGGRDWFGSGSRIIITTRTKHLLVCHGVEEIYDVKELNHEEALQLFSWNAFKMDKVHSSYMGVSNRAILYSCGLPLALEVIGSNLFGRRIDEWSSALDTYERIPRIPNKGILKVLKLSYDDLEEDEKEIFLDLACFFNGDKLGDVTDMLLSGRGIQPESAIGVLIDKSLVKINYDHVITMHGLIQDMGREIVRQESPEEPGNRSRLWFYEDILHVLQENTGTNKNQFIILDLPRDQEVRWSGKAFKKMKNLRMLIIKNACFSRGPIYLPNSLRVLEWKQYPSKILPPDFHPEKLVHLNLSNSSCVSLQPLKARKFESLSRMNFSNCKFLRKVPDLSRVPNLTKLCLDGCTSLIEIHDSVGSMGKLRQLSAERCTNLRTFPHAIKLISLELLRLSWCSSLRSFPKISDKMENMTELSLPGTAIEELPISIRNLSGLEILNLAECRHLKKLPTSILTLPKLGILAAKLCREFRYFNKCEGEEGERASTAVSTNMRFLSFLKCNLSDDSLLLCISCFPNLIYLDLSFNNITTLPACIKECHLLRELSLDYCKQLQKIAEMPPNLETFKAKNCTSLTWLSSSVLFNQAFQQAGNRNFILPGERIPEWFDHYSEGESVCFWVRKEFPAIVVCVVVGVLDDQDCTFNFKLSVRINGTDRKFCSDQGLMSTLEIDHIFICDLQSRLPMAELQKELSQKDEWNHVEILCMNNSWIRLKGGVIKWSAIHVYKQENSMDIENIRFRKPNPPKRTYHEFWNSNNDLEPDCHPLRKKQRTSLDIGVCGCETPDIQQQRCLAFGNVNPISSTACGTVSKHKEKDSMGYNEGRKWLSLRPCWQEPWDYLNWNSNSMKSAWTTENTTSDQDRAVPDHPTKSQPECQFISFPGTANILAPSPTTSSDKAAGGELPQITSSTMLPTIVDGSPRNKLERSLDDVEMEAFYASLDAEPSVLPPFANTRPSEETQKAWETLQDFLSKDFSVSLSPGHYSTMKTTLRYLSNLSVDGGVSMELRSLILEVSREFTQWSRDYNDSDRKMGLSKFSLLKADEIEEGLGVNKNRFREVMAFENDLHNKMTSVEERKKEIEEEINTIRANISVSQSATDTAAKRKRAIFEEGKKLKAERDELREQVPRLRHERDSAEETQANITTEWSKMGEKFNKSML